MDFVTFVILNAVLYIRPMDFVPGIVGLPLYNVAFCICFLFNIPSLLSPGVFRSIVGHPVTICVIGVYVVAVLSNLLQGQVDEAFETADYLFKLPLYYLLMVNVVRTPSRMKILLASLILDGCIVAGLGVADYKGIVSIPNLIVVMDAEVDADGEVTLFRRLAGTGLFGDPNDLSLMIVGCVIFSMYLLADRSVSLVRRAFWLLPLSLLFQTLILTYSRGGAMSLLIGLGVYALLRFGWKRSLPLALLALPILLRGGGRQVDFDVSGGTGQARIVLWDLYMNLFIANPLLGVGANQGMNHAYQVAHNSYINVFAERGFFGGMAFLSAVLLAIWSMVRLKPERGRPDGDELARQRIYLTATLVSYAVGIMTLTRADAIPSYTMLGLAVAYEQMAAGTSPRGPLSLTPKLICLLVAANVAYLIGMYVFIRRNVG